MNIIVGKIMARAAFGLFDTLRASTYTVENNEADQKFIAWCDKLLQAAMVLEENPSEELTLLALEKAIDGALAAAVGVGVLDSDRLTGSSFKAVEKFLNPNRP